LYYRYYRYRLYYWSTCQSFLRESKEAIEVARGTPYNSNADSLALRGQDEKQLVARSEDDGVSPVEGLSADRDDSAASSMESNDTTVHLWVGSRPVLLRPSKEWLRQARNGCGPQRRYAQGQLKQPMGNGKVGAPMVLNADMDQLMESGSPACYHTTRPQRARSFQDALEMLHLTGETGDSA